MEITQDEITEESLDKSILLERFKRFIVSGVNELKNTSKITINDVSLNLCNRGFNKSMIMENIFEEIRRDIDLPDDFLNMLNKFLKEQTKEKERQEKEEYFKELPIEDLEYLTNVCKIYKGLITTSAKDKYPDELIIVLSLILGITKLENNKTKELFESLKIDSETIINSFAIEIKELWDLDIDLLKTKFNKYIYEGRNKGNNSPTIQDIALNVFNDELYKSIEITKYLYKLGLNYDTFKNPAKLIEDYEKKKLKQQEEERQGEKNRAAVLELSRHTSDSKNLIKNAASIYNKLIGIYQKDKEKYKNISSDEDIEILSLTLSLLKSNIKEIKILQKHNLNEKDILEYLELPINYQDEPQIDTNETILANVFIKYVNQREPIISFLNKNDFYNKIINKFVQNPNILKKELETGKNYEETLTIPERIELIKTTPTEPLDLTNMSTVLNFGTSLELHTTFIQDEYPKLMKSNEIETATEEVKRLIDSVYTETIVTEEPKGLFQKLFGPPPEVKKEITLNRNVINSLKPNIEIQIKKLHAEAQKLTELKEYMEEYYKKNQEYIKILETNLTELNKQLKETPAEDIFKIYDLKSYITILENKIETLKLTDSLIKQEYIKINQVIVNHCITINSLLMSRNTLLPLIGTEILIGEGINTEKESIDVTKQILTLLNDIISQDAIGAQEVLEKLKNSNLSQEKLLLITTTTNDHINQMNSSISLEDKIISDIPTLETASTTDSKKLIKKM